jgi:hypothetical protein
MVAGTASMTLETVRGRGHPEGVTMTMALMAVELAVNVMPSTI